MRKVFTVSACLLCLLMLMAPMDASAQQVEQLRSEISERARKIAELEKEIAQYQQSLSATTKQANTLTNQIAQINTTIKKLDTDIKLTETKIEQAMTTMEKLELEISASNSGVENGRETLAESLRIMRQTDNYSLAEVLLGASSLTEFVADYNQLSNLQKRLHLQIHDLRDGRKNAEEKREALTREQESLRKLTTQLDDQKKIAGSNRSSVNSLLQQTKNEEANYRALLADREAKRAIFDRELFEFESQLKAILDPSSLPPTGRGVLAWPLDNVHITQMFGRTVAAARLYVSGSHNGIDLRAAVGTPVKATASGVVTGTGDTDLVCRGASWGRWVLIDHGNGLSSLYGHLSLIKVQPGQTVGRGEVVAYSGNTGYATGPHLHLSVVATQAVKIDNLPSKSCPGAIFRIPLTPANAYFDPMLYLEPR